MKVAILGPLTLTNDSGQALDLRLEPKQEVALVALAANADRGMPLRELVRAVHGSFETALYKRSVESLVSRLRSSLRSLAPDAGALVPPAKAGFYHLAVPCENVDALDFLQRAEYLLNHWGSLSSPERRDLSTKAISVWRADPTRIYGGLSSSMPDVFRRFTSTLAELGERYSRLLLHEERFDEVRRELSRLTELMPGNTRLARLHEEAVGLAVGNPPSHRSGAERPSAMTEIRNRIMATAHYALDVIAVTAHNLDRIYLVDRVAPDHEVKIDVAQEEPGGSGANTVSALARLGCTVGAAGVVADDNDGRRLLSALASGEVDCTNVLVVPGSDRSRSGHSVIFSDPHGVRSIYVHPGVNESFAETLATKPGATTRLKNAVRDSRIVHFTSFTSPGELGLQENLVRLLPPTSLLSLNPGALYSSLGLDRLDPLLSRVNLLFLYEQNLRELVENSAAPQVDTGDSGLHADLKRLYAWKRMKGYDEPLITLIKRYRSSLASKHYREYLTIASGRFALEEAVGTQARIAYAGMSPVRDSTGAGDGMAAALHFCLLRGASLRECADVSFLLATMVSQHVGARAGHPTHEGLRWAWQDLFPRVPEPAAFHPRGRSAVNDLIDGTGGSSTQRSGRPR